MGKQLRLYATDANGQTPTIFAVKDMIRGLNEFFGVWEQYDWVPTFDFEVMYLDLENTLVKGRFVRNESLVATADTAAAAAAVG